MLHSHPVKRAIKASIALSAIFFLLAPAAAAQPAKVVLILDASGSMWGQIEGKAKIEIAKEVLNDLIDRLPPDMQVGLCVYGHRSKGDCQDIEMLVPVGSVDRKAMKAKIAAITPKGMTPLSAAVEHAAKVLRHTEERATVILVSDGLETCKADPCRVAAELAMSGVDFTVHVIGFDISKEEQARLRCLADKTGGLFLAAGNAQALRDALTQTVAKAKEAPKPMIADPGTAKLSAPASVPAGSEFEVRWEGPNSRNDMIAMVPKGSKAPLYQDYAYTEKGNPARLTAPGEPGEYELRYVHAGTRKVIGQTGIRVTPVQAGVKPPATVQVAGEFDVLWQGPDYEGDFITVSNKEDADGAYHDYRYTRRGNPARLRAPSEPGTYEVRYVLAKDTKVLARAALSVEESSARVEPPASAGTAAVFDVRWQGPGNKDDYIAIALPGDDGSLYKAYAYTKNGNPAKLKAPSDPGKYEVRYVLGQGNKVLARAPLAVQASTAGVQAPASVPAGATFIVNWQGPSTEGDYISVASPGEPADGYHGYAHTESGNPVTLEAPADPGIYEVRYILGQDAKVLAKARLTVSAVSASLSAPPEVPADGEFEVVWKGPNYPGDYVTIVAPDAADDAYESYSNTSNGTPCKLKAPAEPGRYEVRYVMGHGNKILGRAPVKVK